MKKIVLYLALISLGIFTSCSSDDGDSGNNPGTQDTMMMKINGEQKNFTSVNVVPVVFTDYTDLDVTATISGNTATTLEMSLEKDNLEAGSVYWFQYTDNEIYYQQSESFSIILTQNSDNKLKGTFSGTLYDTGNPANTITITEGSFDISY